MIKTHFGLHMKTGCSKNSHSWSYSCLISCPAYCAFYQLLWVGYKESLKKAPMLRVTKVMFRDGTLGECFDHEDSDIDGLCH